MVGKSTARESVGKIIERDEIDNDDDDDDDDN